MYVRDDTAQPGFFDLQPADIWPEQSGAYGAVADLIAGAPQPIGAWKLGGTTPLTQEIFNVSELYFGPLYKDEVYPAQSRITGALTECKVELEIACRIDPEARDLDAWCLSAEMPSSGIRDLPDHGVTALIADRCAAGVLVLGEALPISSISEAPQRADLVLEGETLTSGGLPGLVDAPLSIARKFLTRARALGFTPEPGQWIATGGMSPCVPVPRQGAFTVTSDVQSFAFTLDLEPAP